MTGPVPISEIKAQLNDRILDLCRELLPAGHIDRDEWVEAKKSQGGYGDSLSVCLRAPKIGVWAHYAAGDGVAGDAIDLIAYVRTNKNKTEAIAWARSWLGIDAQDPKARKANSAKLEEARRADAALAEKNLAKTRASAFALWLNSQPSLKGTLADRYLQGRGIDLSLLGRQPRVMRFHPAAWCAEVQAKLPALITKIDGDVVDAATGEIKGGCVGVHRTYMQLQPDGRVTKAKLDNAKKSLGSFRGGCIRLWRGASNKPLAAAPEGESVLVCEGIEDGLTLALAFPDKRTLVAVSLSNMGAMTLPAQIGDVIVCADYDEKDAAKQGLTRAVDHFLKMGKRVRVAMPPAGAHDLNDFLTASTSTNQGAA